MKVNELYENLKEYLRDRVDLFWTIEEAKMLGYKIIKLHRCREHEVSLVLMLKDIESDDLQTLGIMVMLDLDRLKRMNVDVDEVKRVIKEFARTDDTFYAEGKSILHVTLRTRDLNHALKRLNEISSKLRSLGVNVSDKFLGYSFMEEEI